MPTTISKESVSALLLRPLTSFEATSVDALWPMVEWRILAQFGGAAQSRILGDVIAAILARMLRNPSGIKTEMSGDLSYTKMSSVDPSTLEPTAEDWRALGRRRSGAFTVDPTAAGAGYAPSLSLGDRWYW